MNVINTILGVPLGFLMRLCYQLCGNYGVAIILFTLATKVLLLPVSVWVHRNGIKMVGLQPELNNIQVKYFGDMDSIAEAQSGLYKREKYNPLASLIPLLIQIVLLIGLIHVIYHPMTYILRLPADEIAALTGATAQLLGIDSNTATIQLSAIEALRDPSLSGTLSAALLAQFPAAGAAALQAIETFQTGFLGLDVCWIPSVHRGLLVFVPLLAGLSALMLSLAQNRLNPLQAEQGKIGKYGTMAFSVGLSLFLGWYVPVGVAIYWIASNLLTVAQQWLLNLWIDPRKHVDYAALEESREALRKLKSIGAKQGRGRDPHAAREKADYKRFFSIINKHLVFYSEKSGFYKYFEGVITYLLTHSNVSIHYITGDPEDVIFEKARENPRIKPYYIGEKKLITLMMRLEADMVLMTMPDLNHFHIRRSYMRKDAEYVFIPHYMITGIRVLRKGALDYFDTVFCTGPEALEEIRQIEQETGAKPKNLVPCGYTLLDQLIEMYAQMPRAEKPRKRILVAPSWQEDNIMDSCLYDVVSQLVADYDVTVRPHPQYLRLYPEKFQQARESVAAFEGAHFAFETDFSSNESVYSADLLVTDWSSISFEYSLATLKPTLHIHTPMKVLNEDLRVSADQDVPLDIRLRHEIGVDIPLEEVKEQVAPAAGRLLAEHAAYEDTIRALREREIYNVGSSARAEAEYILSRIVKKG